MSYPLGGLRYTVGPNMYNDPSDCNTVRFWLARWGMKKGIPFVSSAILFDWRLREAIVDFQRKIMLMTFPDGIVRPGDATERWLAAGPSAPISFRIPKRPPVGPLPLNAPPGTPMRLPARSGAEALTYDQFKAAAATLGCEVAAIQAIGDVEGKGQGFDKYDSPVILFEPTNFRNNAADKTYSQKYPDLTHKRKKPLSAYGSEDLQWEHLQRAYLLDPRAALLSSSWGRFQGLGLSFSEHGFDSPEGMVSALCQSEQAQLAAFVQFIQRKNLSKPLAAKNWQQVASGYNGLNYKDYNYDGMLETAYAKYAN